MRPNHRNALETEIELTAQDLLAPLTQQQPVEIDDIVAIETTYTDVSAANTDQSRDALQETSEIELTAEQMDAMLEGRWP
jgi:ribosome maturation protein Sdo1